MVGESEDNITFTATSVRNSDGSVSGSINISNALEVIFHKHSVMDDISRIISFPGSKFMSSSFYPLSENWLPTSFPDPSFVHILSLLRRSINDVTRWRHVTIR